MYYNYYSDYKLNLLFNNDEKFYFETNEKTKIAATTKPTSGGFSRRCLTN